MTVLLNDAQSGNAALLRCAVLAAVDGENAKSVCDGILLRDGLIVAESGFIAGGTLSPSHFNSAAQVIPNCYWATVGPVCLVFLGGAFTARMATFIWETLLSPPDSFSPLNLPRPFVSVYEEAASIIASRLPAIIQLSSNVIISGYSFGGTVGKWLIKYLPLFQGGQGISLITFGAPKIYKEGSRRPPEVLDECWWCLSDDPVPLVPPDITAYQRILAGLSVFQGAAISGWVRTQRTLQIKLDGSKVWGTANLEIGSDVVSALRTWVAMADAGIPTSHSIATYQARLIASGARLPTAVQPYVPDSDLGGGGGGEGDPVEPSNLSPIIDPSLTPSQVRVVQTTYAQTQFFAARMQAAQPVEIPPAQLFIAYRIGKMWFVDFDGYTIASGPHKRGARQLARFGNAFVRSMQGRSAVSVSDFLAAWQQYIADASNPALGFQPPFPAAL